MICIKCNIEFDCPFETDLCENCSPNETQESKSELKNYNNWRVRCLPDPTETYNLAYYACKKHNRDLEMKEVQDFRQTASLVAAQYPKANCNNIRIFRIADREMYRLRKEIAYPKSESKVRIFQHFNEILCKLNPRYFDEFLEGVFDVIPSLEVRLFNRGRLTLSRREIAITKRLYKKHEWREVYLEECGLLNTDILAEREALARANEAEGNERATTE